MENSDIKEPQGTKLGKRKLPLGSPQVRKTRTRYVWLNVLPDDLWLKVREGETISEAIHDENIELGGDCGGLGKCGKCRVKVLSSVGPPTVVEEELLSEDELQQGIRLACRTIVDKDLVIHRDEADFETEYFQILKTGHRPLVHPDPLVTKRLVTLPLDFQEDSLSSEWLSDLDRIKLVMLPEYKDLIAPLNCLRSLPRMLKETSFSGAAVLHQNFMLAWQKQEALGCYYGLVFDLGTCTLVGKLINLLDGSETAVVSCLNSQMRYGSNVISRLQYVKEHPHGLESFHDLMMKDIDRINKRLFKAANIGPEDIFIAVAAGNTTMQHLLLSIDPSGIAEAPFSPVLTDGLVVRAREVDLLLHPEALLYVMPTKSGYVGGDLISVILASGAAEQDDDIILGLDLGTNGEIFLGNRKRLVTCSAAAGPALEGAAISNGMIAKAGAIEDVYIEDGELRYQIIGNIKPKGLCGSGLVDLVAALLHSGNISYQGLIQRSRKSGPNVQNEKIVKHAGTYNFLVATSEESYNQRPIYLTQKDVRELQLAKGAVAAGISMLMEEMGIRTDDIAHVYLAGALGNYVDVMSAMRIGLIPDFDPGIVSSLGNAASTGASMVLLSKNYWQMANNLSDFIEHIELSSRLDFNQYFVEHIDFPKANLW
ncbi:MAG: DUF4445 domain-containing protein [Dehalococcoidia bacterium]|nr:DUF4445 domain-containing protein [Dehalococcoidia bacterium]